MNVVVRLAWINMPAYHDETFYFDGARAVLKNNLVPWVNFSGYKGPIAYEPVAVLMGFLGIYRWWARILIYLCSSVSLWLVYRLGKKLFSETVGLASMGLLFLMPLFMVHSFLYTDAVPLMMMLLLTLNYYFDGQKNKYFFCSILLVLTKETAIFIPFFLFLVGGGWPVVIVPTVGFGIWTLINKVILGFYLLPYSMGLLWSNGWQTRLVSGLMNWGTVWWLLAVGGLLIARWQGRKIKMKVVILFLGVYLFYNLVYGVTYFNQRYLLMVMPLVIIIFCYFLKLFWGNSGLRKGVIIVGLCLILTQVGEWRWGKIEAGGDDLRVLRITSLQKEVAAYLGNNYAEDKVLAGWPLASYINDPFYGYVKKTILTESFRCDEKENIVIPETTQVIVISKMDCNLGIDTEKSGKLVKSFQDGTVMIYEK